MTRRILWLIGVAAVQGCAFGARVADMTGTVFTQDRQAPHASPLTIPLLTIGVIAALWLGSDKRVLARIGLRERAKTQPQN